MVELPSVNASRWRVREWTLDLTATIAIVGISLVEGARLWSEPGTDKWGAIGTLTLTLLAFAATVAKSSKARKDELKFEPLDEPEDIKAWATGLVENLKVSALPANTPTPLRVTVHKVIWDKKRLEPQWLEQVISYAGAPGGLPGHLTSCRAGIIGRCCRTGDVEIAKRDPASTSPAYTKELVRLWGFHRREAAIRAMDRMAWMAVPLSEKPDGLVFAVVYADTDNPAIFDDVHVQKTIYSACIGLAQLCRQRYSMA